MSRIWVRVVKRHRALRETAAPCARDEVEERLRDVCREFDIPSPMWLDKQRGELERFGATAFARDNFFEPIDFDRLELHYLLDDGVTRRSRDPRNDFSDPFG